MKSCNDFLNMMSAYIDNELKDELRKEFMEHVNCCADCRAELEEMEHIVGLCRSISEEELPADFKQQLHEKLLSVNESSVTGTSDVKQIKGPRLNKYIKVIASVAAVFLIAVMLKAVFPMNGISQKTTSSIPAADSAAGAAEPQETEEKADYGVADSFKSEDQNGSNVIIGAENAPVESGNAKTPVPEDKNINDEKKARAASPKKAYAKDSRKSSVTPPEAESQDKAKVKEAPEQAMMFTTLTTAENVMRNSVITVKVENPESEIGIIKEKTLEFGAEYKDKEADPSGGALEDVRDPSVPLNLAFEMPYSQYDRLIEKLRSDYSDSFGVEGTPGVADTDQRIKELEKQLAALDEKLSVFEAAGTSTGNEEFIKLRAERDSAQKELDTLLRDRDYISVCIEVNKK